jgi:glutathionylspermidine synthase
MKREISVPRPDWRERCEAVGFSFHSIDGIYWDESACYAFSADEIDELEAATASLHQLCLEACEHVVAARLFEAFAIPGAFAELVTDSWRKREGTLFGRFDFAWNGEGPPKLLEYNADTPTALLEASVVQWHWMQEVRPDADQFNSIHEKLIAQFAAIAPRLRGPTLHFASVRASEEDYGNSEYVRDCAIQAGLRTAHLAIEDIGWDARRRCFVDLDDAEISTLVKLYPWEWLMREAFAPHILERSCRWVEPPWKALLSNKAMLAALWELFPGHPNLLPTYLEPGRIDGDYVKKPRLAREGANVSIRRRSGAMVSGGSYGAEGYVYQALAPLPDFDRNFAVIGSWIVGDAAAGIGVREDATPITTNTSRFVPHYFY